ncbi:MAG: glycosyltransferase family 2 protein [Leptolyngbyaceae cyanobacterium bins.302]|nr:glycosyltransferase family 2 protein [Leptolyngbyaceae cyanobacterium bins.302]
MSDTSSIEISDTSSLTGTVEIRNDFLNETNGSLQRYAKKSHQTSKQQKAFVSLVTPAYNEALILEKNLAVLCSYMESLESEYDWEVIVINDGSRDSTGECAEAFAKTHPGVRVIHHLQNCGVGQALKTGFEHSRGDYIITLDLDLSYSPEHIELLMHKIRETGAKVVVSSPYTKGGKVSNVPWLRWVLSLWANRFLSFASKSDLSTLTSMVRVYDANFVHSLNLRSMGMEINPEVLHKAKLLEAKIAEVPAHLKWHSQKAQPKSKRRKSSMRILKHTWAIFFFGFLFRPVMFFILPSLMFFLISCYANAWVIIHCWNQYRLLGLHTPFVDQAVAAAFQQSPHTFIIGGMSLMLAIQLFSLGVLSVQNKRYFEEVFYLGTSIYKSTQRNSQREE